MRKKSVDLGALMVGILAGELASTSPRRLAWWIVGLWAMVALALGYWAWTVRTAATVIVEWTTASELNTAGFNLYRRDSPDGPFTRLN